MTERELYTTQADIEREIMRLADILENTTNEFAGQLQDQALKESKYRIAFARAFTTFRMGEKPLAEKSAEQKATIECESELLERKSADAIVRATEEKLRSLRAQLDAVRTLSANVRSQT